MRFPGQPFVGFVTMIAEANGVENRQKKLRRRRGRLSLFNHYFYFAAGLQPVARVQSIEHAEAFERAVGDRHSCWRASRPYRSGATVTTASRSGLACSISARLMRRNVPTDSRNARSVSGVRCLAAKMKR